MSHLLSEFPQHYGENKYDFNVGNLEKILSVSKCALEHHSRVLAFRVDLHFPKDPHFKMLLALKTEYSARVIKAFFKEFHWLISRDEDERRDTGKRVHSTDIRYVWAREQTCETPSPHYHMMILLNRDAYYKLGSFDSEKLNLANKIRMAWYRAVYDDVVTLQFCKSGLVHFPENAEYHVNKNDVESLKEMLKRVAYLAKNETKRRGEGYRCFGGSNN